MERILEVLEVLEILEDSRGLERIFRGLEMGIG